MKTAKKTYGVLLIMLILSGFGFNACKNDKDDEPDLTQQDQTFAKNASASNISEIQFGQLAVQKATNDSISAFARTMITDHTSAKNSLDSIARSLNLTLSDSMDASHRTLYNTFSALNGSSFDSAYIQSQVQDHQSAQSLLQSQISNGKNDRLVSYAKKNLPVINGHLQLATRLRTYISQDSTSQGK